MVFTISGSAIRTPRILWDFMTYHLLREAFYNHPNQDFFLPLISITVLDMYLNSTPTYINIFVNCSHSRNAETVFFSLSFQHSALYFPVGLR